MVDIAAWATGIIALIVPGFGADEVVQFNGYVEADYVYAAAASPGRIEDMFAAEGADVAAGTLLFTLEDEQQAALLRAAEARVAVAEATWRNLETGGRADEIAVIRASLNKAEADLELARSTLQRAEVLLKQGVVSEAKIDADRALVKSGVAQVAQLSAQLRVAELPARDAQRVAAEAGLEAARADMAKAAADLADRRVIAASGGLVERVYFRAGEVVGAGTPVISLLPPGAKKIRFFIQEAVRARFKPGQVLTIRCDGCPPNLSATLTRMASDPQFTPPIIFSREERGRLVFMAEAQLSADADLLPGQPVTVVEQ